MNIVLFGYGKMGKAIETIAQERGHTIVGKVSSAHPKESIDYTNADVIIEFSRPEFAEENIRFAIEKKLPIVVGTTGWYEALPELEQLCETTNGALLHATNFSLGVNLFFAVNTYLARLMTQFDAYSASITEIHHTEKLDAPSGTGISLAEQVIAEHERYHHWENTNPANLTDEKALAIVSERLPNVPGTHDVIYQSEIDTIEIKHTAHNRKGFAQGSVLAAEWLVGKSGVYTMKDVLNL